MERECLDCGSPIRGRSDKKFCDDQCRSNYNNRQKAGHNSALRSVNAILRKNHSILSRLCRGSKTRIKKDDLLRNGFDFSYHTHFHHTQSGHVYYFCYDHGYLKLNNETFLIVRKSG